jgi:hypothetical protein
VWLALVLLVVTAAPGRAQDRLCDPGDEDCRSILIVLSPVTFLNSPPGALQNDTRILPASRW